MTRLAQALLLTAALLVPTLAQAGVAPAPTLATADRVLDSVVAVAVPVRTPDLTNPTHANRWPWPPGAFMTTGSGFVVGPVEILTSARAVCGLRAVNVTVRGGAMYRARSHRRPAGRRAAARRLPPAALTLGSNAHLTVGRLLVAVGLTPGGGVTTQEVTLGADLLTLNGPVSAAMRGAPLLNAAGQVVGLVDGSMQGITVKLNPPGEQQAAVGGVR